MKIIKAIVFACVFLLTLTASDCFVVSSFNSSSDRDDDTQSGFFIGVIDAESTSSETVQALTQTLLVAEVASHSTQYVDDIRNANPTSYFCDNNTGTLTVTIYDLDNSNKISVGDDLFLNYSNCKKDNISVSGGFAISVLDAKGNDIGRFDTGTDWLLALSINIDPLTITNENKALSADGSIIVSLQFDAISASLETNIKSNALTLNDGSNTTLSNTDISQLINLAVAPSSYTLIIDAMDVTSSKHNGTVSAKTQASPLVGIESLNINEFFIDLQLPESGELNIAGYNSNANISIMPGDMVTINVDTNGDLIADDMILSTWSDINH